MKQLLVDQLLTFFYLLHGLVRRFLDCDGAFPADMSSLSVCHFLKGPL